MARTDSGRLIAEVDYDVHAEVDYDVHAELDGIVRELLVSTGKGQITAEPMAWHCLSSGRPNPTHRYDHVVA
jgi:hypothetical protein